MDSFIHCIWLSYMENKLRVKQPTSMETCNSSAAGCLALWKIFSEISSLYPLFTEICLTSFILSTEPEENTKTTSTERKHYNLTAKISKWISLN